MRVLALCLALAAPAAAQDVIGTTVLGGKRVELLSDNTWRFAEIPDLAPNCVPMNSALAFCGSIFHWRPVSVEQTDLLRAFRHDHRLIAGIVYEEIGTRDGVTQQGMRSMVVENAAYASGVRVADIPVLDLRSEMVDDIHADTMIYGVRIGELSYVYMNTLIVSETRSLQLMSWHVGTELTSKQEKWHRNFLVSIEVTLPDGRL